MPDLGPLVIWGASGHGKVVADAARRQGYRLVGFLDDAAAAQGAEILQAPVLGGGDLLGSLPAGCRVCVAIGACEVRAALQTRVEAAGLRTAAVIHPDATVAASAVVGGGAMILARAVVNADAAVGRGAIINTGAIVEHDCTVGDFAHLSPGAVLGGNVHLGEQAHVGLGACVLPGRRIGRAAVVGAGAVVVRDVGDAQTVMGVPARTRSLKSDL